MYGATAKNIFMKNIDKWYGRGIPDEFSEDSSYVDMTVNPERFTGYKGAHVWSAIYSENCFT